MTTQTIELTNLDMEKLQTQVTTTLDPQTNIPDFGSYLIFSFRIPFPRLQKGALYFCIAALAITFAREVLFSAWGHISSKVVSCIIYEAIDVLNLYIVWKYKLYQHHVQSWFLLLSLPLTPLLPIIVRRIALDFFPELWYGDWFLSMSVFGAVLAILMGASFWKQRSQLRSSPSIVVDPESQNAAGVNQSKPTADLRQPPESQEQFQNVPEPPPYTFFASELDHTIPSSSSSETRVSVPMPAATSSSAHFSQHRSSIQKLPFS